MSQRSDTKLEGLHYETLSEWVHSGKETVLDAEMVEYLDQLDLIRGWRYSLKTKSAIIKALQHKYKTLTYSAADTRYKDSMNYFYGDNEVKKQAWTNILVEDASRCYQAIILSAKEPKHYLDAIKGIQTVANLLGLDKEEPEPLPDHLLEEKIPLITMDPKKVNLPETDRNLLMKQLDKYNIPETDKERIKEESGYIPFKVAPDNE